MNLKNIVLMAAFGLIMSAFTIQAGPAYTIVDLGTLGGATYASAINSTGEVAGYSYLSNGDSRAFLYEKGVMHDIGFLGTNKSDQSYAYAINASGVVVGASQTNPTTGIYHAFLFNGQMHDLGTLGGSYSSANGINNIGQVVGWANTTTANNVVTHAFVYNAGKMVDIGVLGGNLLPNSSASGINQIGQIVGSSTYPNDTDFDIGYHAFLYANSHMYDLGINPGLENLYSYAAAMNDHAQVVGETQDGGGDIVFGFVYSAGAVTKINNIVPVNGPQVGVEPEAINNSGVVVGHDPSEPPYGREFGSGFIYRGGMTTDANTLIPANSGWIIADCTGINDNGQICGWGQHNGLLRAFVMTPIRSPLLP